MYNNYSYNPYYQQQRVQPIQQLQPVQPMYQQPLQQPVQNSAELCRPILNGKQVDSIDVVKATDIPLDGSISYFPIVDGSAIVSKQLQMDGTSKIVVFKPVEQQKEEIHYITREDMEKAIRDLDFDEIDDIKKDLKDLKLELKEIKKTKKRDD